MKIKLLDKTGNVESTLLINSRKSILDNILDNNIDIFYGCMGGSCSACKCEIIKGGEFIDKEAIRPAVFKDVKENEFLSCIAKLKSTTPEDAEIIIKKKL